MHAIWAAGNPWDLSARGRMGPREVLEGPRAGLSFEDGGLSGGPGGAWVASERPECKFKMN